MNAPTVERPLLLASGNAKKRAEMERLLSGLPYVLRTLQEWPDLPEAPEDEDTFAGNARSKALYYAEHTGLLAVADDSGLEVDALGGAPGVYSARYAGEPCSDERNNQKLLAELAGIPDERRTARFRCAVALARPGEVLFEAQGVTEGRILHQPQGEQGFGYDPLFLSKDLDRVFGECPAADKDRVSHRGRALAALLDHLRQNPTL